MVLGVLALTPLDVVDDLPLVLAVVTVIAVVSATLDIAADATAVQLLEPSERGVGNGIQKAGGYLGLMVGGGAGLVIYDWWGGCRRWGRWPRSHRCRFRSCSAITRCPPRRPANAAGCRCDVLIDRGPVPHPYETVDDDGREARSAAVAKWLDATAGEGGLVRQLANQYAEIGYFAVSALDAFGAAPRASARTGRDVHNDPPSAPLRWLLAERTAA